MEPTPPRDSQSAIRNPQLAIPPSALPFAAYLFDLDGTLADSMPLHYRAWRATLDPRGAEYPEEMFQRLGGTPTRRIVEILNERQGLAMDPEEIASEKEQRYIASLDEAKPIPAVVAGGGGGAAERDRRRRGVGRHPRAGRPHPSGAWDEGLVRGDHHG